MIKEKVEEILSRLNRENWVIGDYFHALYVEGIQKFLNQTSDEIIEDCNRNCTNFHFYYTLQTELRKKFFNY